MLVYIIAFIIGGLITLILYGKVPMIVTLIISFIAGSIIGLISYSIKRRKAEQDYIAIEMLKRHMNYQTEKES